MKLATVLATAALVLAACAPPPPTPVTTGSSQPPAPTRAENQVLRIGVGGMQATPSPESSASNIPLFMAMYDPVVTFGKNFEVRPAVAEKWELRPDGVTWRFTIRKGLTFSNGDPLTADDVAFTYNLIVRTNTPQKGNIGAVTSANVIDPSTVDVITSKKDVSTLNGSAYVFVLPKKYYEAVGKDGFATKAIGSGPYLIQEFRSNDTLHYKLRPDKHPYRTPTATEIIFKALPEASSAIAGLSSGELDATTNSYTADQVNQLKSRGLVISQNLASNQSVVMGKPENEARKTPLTNIKVREALNYAVNKEAIAKNIYGGFAEVMGQNAIPASKFYDPDAKPIPYDPAKAKQLLAEAGYPNGFKLENAIDYSTAQVRPDLLLAIQADLKAVGVEVGLNNVELGVFVDKAYGRNNQVRGDLWQANVGDANGMVTQLAFAFFCQANPQASWYCVPEFERLMKLAYEESDPGKQTDLMRQANRAFRAEWPAIWLIATPIFVVHSPKLAGIDPVTPQFYNWDGVYRTT